MEEFKNEVPEIEEVKEEELKEEEPKTEEPAAEEPEVEEPKKKPSKQMISTKTARMTKTALQYSKWLSRFICWVWAIYRFTTLLTAALVPAAADAVVSTVGTLDTIMIINEGTYLVNSLGEKYIFSDRFVLTAFNKGWFKSFFKGIKVVNDDDDEEEGNYLSATVKEDEEIEEEDDNG